MKLKKATRIARRGGALAQVAALPYRRGASGVVHFMLLTSRETKRFVIPKGWRMKGKSEPQAAALEAGQEAGVSGRVDPVPIGTYSYWKRLRRAFLPVRVTVGKKTLEDGAVDIRSRATGEEQRVAIDDLGSLR